MRHHFIWWINLSVTIVSALLIFGAGTLYFSRNQAFIQAPIPPRPINPNPSSFVQSKEAYALIGHSSMQLDFTLPKRRVPDIRTLLSFYGENKRPDQGSDQVVFFRLGSSQDIVSRKAGSPIYLKVQDQGNLIFSPENTPTDLWMDVKVQDNQALIQVSIKDEEGFIQNEPKEFASFVLQEAAQSSRNLNFSIGPIKVDGTLLARQKAKWSGKDQFLMDHGGDEFSGIKDKERIVFGDGHVVYVGKNDFLIWQGDKWEIPLKGVKTENFPILVVTKIDERVMSFDLFSVGGTYKTTLNLLKIQDPIPPYLVEKDFQFVGSRTKIHSMFKIHQKREIVGPGDWFLLTSEGWIKLKSAKEVDRFVEGQMRGPLLIIDQIEKTGEHTVLAATLYNSSRSSSIEVKLPNEIKRVIKEEEAPSDAMDK